MHIFVFLRRFLENEIFRILQPAWAAIILQNPIFLINLKVFQKKPFIRVSLKLNKKLHTISIYKLISIETNNFLLMQASAIDTKKSIQLFKGEGTIIC